MPCRDAEGGAQPGPDSQLGQHQLRKLVAQTVGHADGGTLVGTGDEDREVVAPDGESVIAAQSGAHHRRHMFAHFLPGLAVPDVRE